MLPRHNRIIEPGVFRQVVRRGGKHVTKSVIVYQHPSESIRVGVVVTTKCGNAVVRNRLRRRTRAICRELIDSGDLTGDVVIRFRCEGNSPSFDELRHELVEAIVR